MSRYRKFSVWVLGVVVFLLWSYAMMMAWSAPLLVVSGSVKDATGAPQNGWKVEVENTMRGWTDSDITGAVAGSGVYQITRLDFQGGSVAEPGDVVKVTFTSPDAQLMRTVERTLTSQDIQNANIVVDLPVPTPSPRPTLTRIAPDSVRQTGGATLTLTGTAFQAGAVLIVGQTGTEATEVPTTFTSATQLTALLPKLPMGTHPITVKNPDGQTTDGKTFLTVTSAVREDPNGDGSVDIADLVLVALAFGQQGAGLAGDINGDGEVNILDLVLIALRFGEQVAPAAPALVAARGPALVATATAALDADILSVELSFGQEPAAPAVAGYHVDIVFDPAQLEFLGAEEGSALRTHGETFWVGSYPHEAVEGRARVIGVLLGGRDAVVSGGLARMRFRVVGDARRAGSAVRVETATLADREGRRMEPRWMRWVREVRLSADARTLVGRNYPNPFNPETWIPFQLAEDSRPMVRIFSPEGALVRHLDLGWRPAGAYVTRDRALYWDGRNAIGEPVSSGVYFYEFRAATYVRVGRMLVLK
jgi:hypothetical protein